MVELQIHYWRPMGPDSVSDLAAELAMAQAALRYPLRNNIGDIAV